MLSSRRGNVHLPAPYFVPGTRSPPLSEVPSEVARRRELLSGYKLGAKWRETVRCSTREDIAAMYRITGTRFYSGHGRIVGWQRRRRRRHRHRLGGGGRRRRRRRRTAGWRWWKAVEIQDRGITNACRPSFVAGALTANSKLR